MIEHISVIARWDQEENAYMMGWLDMSFNGKLGLHAYLTQIAEMESWPSI